MQGEIDDGIRSDWARRVIELADSVAQLGVAITTSHVRDIFPPAATRAESDLLDLLGTALKAIQSESLPSSDTDAAGERFQTLAVEAAEYSRRNLDQRISVNRLGREVRGSPSTVERAFERVFGVTVGGYSRCVRAEIARQRLQDTGEKTEAIARSLGMSRTTLSRLLRRKFGLGASEIRRANLGKPGSS